MATTQESETQTTPFFFLGLRGLLIVTFKKLLKAHVTLKCGSFIHFSVLDKEAAPYVLTRPADRPKPAQTHSCVCVCYLSLLRACFVREVEVSQLLRVYLLGSVIGHLCLMAPNNKNHNI